MPKDLLSLGELEPLEFEVLLNLADAFKVDRETHKFARQIPGTSLALIFEKPSTRTRVSFEVGMFELGGHAIVLNSRDMQLSRGESLEDTAKALSEFCHAICARVVSHDTLVGLSRNASVPVINALSDLYHPCQSLADMQTIRQFKGILNGLKLAWIGDGNNVCNSLIIGSALSGVNMTVACPKKHSPLDEALRIADRKSKETGAELELVEDASEAVDHADVVVTDTFVSMGLEEERKERIEAFLPSYQVNEELMSRAKPDAIFMHCLPAHRGEEVVSSVIDGAQSVVWQEAQNRLHAQKALLYSLMRKYSNAGPRDNLYR
ncbi:MAG: ornithine carbamoyltransferase [Nitrososphaerales archaeon]